jgi:hypothetical protein
MPKTTKSELLSRAWKISVPGITEENPIGALAFSPRPHADSEKYQAHAFWEMGVVLDGAYRFKTVGGDTVIAPGGCWWTGPWEPHAYKILKAGTRLLVLGFIPAALSALAVAGPHPLPYSMPFLRPESRTKLCRQSAETRKRILWLAEAWARLLQNRPAGWQTSEHCYFGLILAEIFSGYDFHSAPLAGGKQAVEQILNAVDFINRNLHRKLSLGEAAQRACLGRTQFVQYFKDVAGTPFAKYVIQRRLERVHAELLNG